MSFDNLPLAAVVAAMSSGAPRSRRGGLAQRLLV